MRLVVPGLEEVRIVRTDHRHSNILRQLEDLAVEVGLSFGLVCLDLQVIAVFEYLGVPGGRFPRGFLLIVRQVPCNLSGKTGGRRDQPLRVTLKKLPVDPGSVVEALRVSEGRQLYQVPVSLAVPRNQYEVVIVRSP